MVELHKFSCLEDVEEAHALISRYLPEPYVRTAFIYHYIMHHDYCYTAKDSGKVVGAVLCSVSGEVGQVSMLCVDIPHRRTGVASMLLSATISEMRKKGIRKVELEVDSKDRHALALYEKVGFRRTNYYERCYLSLRSSYSMVLEL
jgi:ribosomal protein S18 acetylase RimI-like enzyme